MEIGYRWFSSLNIPPKKYILPQHTLQDKEHGHAKCSELSQVLTYANTNNTMLIYQINSFYSPTASRQTKATHRTPNTNSLPIHTHTHTNTTHHTKHLLKELRHPQ